MGRERGGGASGGPRGSLFAEPSRQYQDALRKVTVSHGIAGLSIKSLPPPLLGPLLWHRPRQLVQLHPFRLPAVEDRLLNVGRQKGEPQ